MSLSKIPCFLALLLTTACAREVAPRAVEDAYAIRTDRVTYALQTGEFGPELTIVSRFQAPKNAAVYLVNCNGVFAWRLQKLVDSGWADAWAPAMDACLSAPIEVPAGGTLAGSHLIRPGAGAILYPSGTSQELGVGTYRLVWDGVLTSFSADRHPFGEDLALEQRMSNPFAVRK